VWKHQKFWCPESLLRPAHGRPDSAYMWAAWTCDDRLIVGAMEEVLRTQQDTPVNPEIHVWNVGSSTLLHVLRGHTNSVSSVLPHPTCSSLVATTGQDGKLMFWDVRQGVLLRETVVIFERNGQRMPVECLDCAFSPTGTNLSIVDSLGHWSLYGLGKGRVEPPPSQFFNNDYFAVIRQE
jgi:WD40 repeat protein